MNIFTRVANWNEARYDQEFDMALTLRMLREELREFQDSTTEVEKLDGLCDINFVATGAVWKLGIVIEEAHVELGNELLDSVQALKLSTPVAALAYFIETLPNIDGPNATPILAVTLMSIAQLSSICMESELGLSEELATQAVLAVCDSNDTKSINKLAATDKGFADGKGPYYVAPTVALLEILQNAKY